MSSPLCSPRTRGRCVLDAGLAEPGPPARWTEGLEEATPRAARVLSEGASTARGLVAWAGAPLWGLWELPEGGCVQGVGRAD